MSNLTNTQANQVFNLRKAGYSIRDIAAELGLKKYQVEQVVNQQRESPAPLTHVPPIPTPVASPSRPSVPMVDLTAPSPQLLEKERRLTSLQAQLEADRAALSVKAQTLADQEKQLAIKSNMVSVATREHSDKQNELVTLQRSIENERRELENRYNELNASLQASPQLLEKEQQLAIMQTRLEADRAALKTQAGILADQEKRLALRSDMVSMATREHNDKLNELATLQRTLADEKRELESRYTESNGFSRSTADEQVLYEVFRKRARKEKLAKRYNGLVQELLVNCDGCTWSGEDVDDYLERLESLKDKIIAFCDENGINPAELLLFQGLIFLSNDVEGETEHQTSGLFSGSSVKFNYGPDYQAKLQSLTIQTFDDPAPEGLNEPDGREEEETD